MIKKVIIIVYRKDTENTKNGFFVSYGFLRVLDNVFIFKEVFVLINL